MATINVSMHYRMPGLGAIAPGWIADIVLLRGINEVEVDTVMTNGQIVVEHGRLVCEIVEPIEPFTADSVLNPELSENDFLMLGGNSGEVEYNGKDFSSNFTRTTIKTTNRDGMVSLPLPSGISIAAIVPRHGQGTRPSLVLINGYKLEEGAIASTVSPDSHNLAVIDKNPHDMLVATNELARVGGGLTAVKSGKVLATVPLPIAGLMSTATVEEVASQQKAFEEQLLELGLPRALPAELIVFALSVVPDVRLTDRGLVDVASQQFIPLIV